MLTLFVPVPVPVSDQEQGAAAVGCWCRFDGACIRNKARVPGDWRRSCEVVGVVVVMVCWVSPVIMCVLTCS